MSPDLFNALSQNCLASYSLFLEEAGGQLVFYHTKCLICLLTNHSHRKKWKKSKGTLKEMPGT